MIDIEQFASDAKKQGFTDEQIRSKLLERKLIKDERQESLEAMEKRIEEKYSLKLQEEVAKAREELKQETKSGLKNVLKHFIFGQ